MFEEVFTAMIAEHEKRRAKWESNKIDRIAAIIQEEYILEEWEEDVLKEAIRRQESSNVQR